MCQELERHYGKETLQRIVRRFTDDCDAEENVRVPRGFWKWFIEQNLYKIASNRERMHCSRCFVFYIETLPRIGGGHRNVLSCSTLLVPSRWRNIRRKDVSSRIDR